MGIWPAVKLAIVGGGPAGLAVAIADDTGLDLRTTFLILWDLVETITGILVVRHQEPYGSFSVDTPEFAAQFVRKNIRDRFRVGRDIDAVSTATMTVTSSTRAVRNAARRIARQFLVPSGSK